MRKYLKLISLISFVLLFRMSVFAIDTLKTSKNNILVSGNFGLSVYNRLLVYSNIHHKDDYFVNSKIKNSYDLSFTNNRNKLNYIVGLSFIQSEFDGKEFNMGAGDIPYKGVKYPYYYNLYQHIKYNVLYANIGVGYNHKFSKKHQLSCNLFLCIPAIYDITINNIYSKTNQVNDTTLFEATKNAKNTDTNFGRLPRINISLTYNYFFTNKLACNLNLSFLYAYSYNMHRPDDYKYETVFDHTNNYSFLAYSVRKQIVLTPSIGISYKLN